MYNYVYDNTKDTYFKKKVESDKNSSNLNGVVSEADNNNIDYLSFNTIDEGLVIIANLNFLYNRFDDNKYIQLKNEVINKLKSM